MEPISIEVALSLIQALESEIRYLRREVASERQRADMATRELMRIENDLQGAKSLDFLETGND